MINQIRNILCPGQKFQRNMSKVRAQYDALLARNKVLKALKFFFRPRAVVGKYLKIIHLGVGGSTSPSRTKNKMSLTYCPQGGEKGKPCLCASVRQLEVDLLSKFTNHDDFALSVRYRP